MKENLVTVTDDGYKKVFDLGFDALGNFYNKVNNLSLEKSGGGVTVVQDSNEGLVASFYRAYIYSETALGISLKNKDWRIKTRVRLIDPNDIDNLTLIGFGTDTMYYRGMVVSLYGFVTSKVNSWDAIYVNPPNWPGSLPLTSWVDVYFSKNGIITESSINTVYDPTPIAIASMDTYYEDKPGAISIGGNLYPPSNTSSCMVASVSIYVKS